MTYSSINAMGSSQSLNSRLAACAAEQGNLTPAKWASENLLPIAANPAYGFAAAWDYALGTYSADANPDTGARPGVISDAMILSAVQARKSHQSASDGWPAA